MARRGLSLVICGVLSLGVVAATIAWGDTRCRNTRQTLLDPAAALEGGGDDALPHEETLAPRQARGIVFSPTSQRVVPLGILGIALLMGVGTAAGMAEGAARTNRKNMSVLQAVVDAMQDGAWVFDARGRIRSVNRAALERFGYQKTELLGRSINVLVPGLLPQGEQTQPHGASTTGSSGDTDQHRVLAGQSKDGSMVPLELTIRRLRLGGGLTYLVVAKAVAASRIAEGPYQVFFEKSPDPSFLFDDTGIVDCNDAALRALRCTDKQQILHRHPAVFSPDVQPDGSSSLDKGREMVAMGRRKGLHRFDWIHRRMNGEPFAVEVSLTPVTLDGRPSLLIVWHDLTARREMDAAWRQLASVVESSEDAIISVAEDGTILSWNLGAQRVYGYSGADVIGRSFDLLIPPDATDGMENLLGRVCQGEAVSQYEMPHLAKGGVIDVSLTVSPLQGSDGRSLGFSIIARDVTQQKRIERDLSELATRNESIVWVIGEIVYDRDVPGRRIEWSGQPERVIGYTIGEMSCEENFWLALIHPDDLLRIQAVLAKPPSEGGVVELEYRVRHKDGQYVWVYDRGAMHCDEAGEPTRIIGVMWDVTERKLAEDAVRVSEERYRSVVDNIREVIFQTDLDGRWTFLNPAWSDVTGYSVAESLGRSFAEFLAAEDRERCRRIFAMLVDGRKRYTRHEARYMTPDGAVRWAAVYARPITDADGVINGVAGTWDDVTQRKQAEEKLRQQTQVLKAANMQLEAQQQELRAQQEQLQYINEQLTTAWDAAQAASQAKSEFLANMSHEIRTPMTAILGYAELLREEVGQAAGCREQTEAVDTILRSGTHLLQIINDILDLSKIEAGRMTIERTKCSPVRLVEEVESSMRVRATGRGLSLDVEFDGFLPETVETDVTRLRQILLNLVGNAIKFTEVGGVRIIIRMAQVEELADLLSAQADRGTQPSGHGCSDAAAPTLGKGPFLRFDVIDTGIGMSDAEIAQLFQPFRQADASTTRRFGGTGLGLTICKRLARILGGDIFVRSVPGKGSTFTFLVETGALEGVRRLSPEELSMLRRPSLLEREGGVACSKLDCRILLAEDGPDNQRLISFVLRKAGADVVVVDNGQAAVEAATKSNEQDAPFDLILMDMQMPTMDGYEATRRLRSLGYKAPVVALTAHAMSGDREKCLEAGCDDFATKPINRDRLIQTIFEQLQPREPCEAT